MSIYHNESCHGVGDVEVGVDNTFYTPDAIIKFKNDTTVGTTAVRVNDGKVEFTVGMQYGPRNIDPNTDPIAAELGQAPATEFRKFARGVIDRFMATPVVANTDRVAIEADYERVNEAAFYRVEVGSLTVEDATLVWRAFESRNKSFAGIPYSDTESILDMPSPIREPLESRTSLPA